MTVIELKEEDGISSSTGMHTISSSPNASFQSPTSPDASLPNDCDSIQGIAHAQGTTIISSEDKLCSSRFTTPSVGISSLRYSAIYSSISSMFDNTLDRSSTNISEEEEVFDEISQHSDGDLLIISKHGGSSKSGSGTTSVPKEIALEPGINRHDFNALVFEQVGQQLFEDMNNDNGSVHSAHITSQGNGWPNLTEQEWDQFVYAANEVLPVLDPSECVHSTLNLPPESSEHEIEQVASKVDLMDFSQYLPREFICSQCKLPIVGSTTLDCGCNKSFCSSCIQNYNPKYVATEKESIKAENESLKGGIFHKKCIYCPLCSSSCHQIPCHALDVAILEKIMNLERIVLEKYPRGETNVKIYQAKFYERLRKEINRQHAERDHYHQLLLANYAHNEKEALEHCERQKQRKYWYQKAEGLLLINVIIFAGVKVLAKMRSNR